MKIFKLILISISLYFISCLSVQAKTEGYICDVAGTDGVLYSSDWSFQVFSSDTIPSEILDNLSVDKNKLIYRFAYSVTTICDSSSGCFDGGTSLGNIENISSDKFFVNVGENVSGAYTTSKLINALNNGKCPKYIYAASNDSNKKIGFIFSDKEISNASEIFSKANYYVRFEESGKDSDALNIELFENQIEKMKSKLQEYKNGDWGNVYNSKCDGLTYFGGMNIGTNIILEEYDKYRDNLPSNYKISDEARSIYSEYRNAKCKANSSTGGGSDKDYSLDLSGPTIDCETQGIIDWILNMIRLVGIILMIVLGMLDFIKAAASGEQEEMKKSRTKFVKRLIACVVLFLIPIIVNILLGLINLGSGVSCN